MPDTKPPIVRKRSEVRTVPKPTAAENRYTAKTQAVVSAARDKANSVVHSAREWLTPSSEWTTFPHLDSLSTVMFSPLAAHPVYRSESMVKALQLMQQQQTRQNTNNPSSSMISTSRTDLVLHGKMYAWPSSTVLLQADIPEPSSVSLFQGFASAYPSLAKPTKPSSSRKPKQRKKKSNNPNRKDLPRSLTQIISEREKRARDCDKISMQKSSTANEIDQINLQINQLLDNRKALEEKWEKLESKDIQLQLIIDDLNEAILDIEEGESVDGGHRRSKSDVDSADEEDYESGTCFKTLEGHTDDVICVDFNHPKGMMVSSSMDGTVRAWDLYRNKCLGTLEGHQGLVRCLQLDEARLLTGSDDGTIKQWDLSLIEASSSSISSFSVFSSAPSSPSLTAVDSGLINETFTLEGHQSEVTAIFADRNSVVSGSGDKTIKQWDLETQECILTLDVLWASGNSKNIVDSWLDNASSGYGYASHDFVGALQFWDSALASGTSDGKIRMWDLRTGQAHRTLPGHNAPITCLQFDEVHLVSGSLDKTIRIWDLRTGSVFDTLTYTTPVSSLQFNSGKIISSGTSNTIDIYNRTSFQHTSLSGHRNRVNSICFHNDVLASAGSDNVIKMWSI
ncbi:WD40-repeat-containing domain protein [Mucor mucedo]|uniref:WD40-repeat-containing domain protein n=1 Tax=Mucor mucedo TaxID=29922 RepID=UPI00221FBF07|nr:WD40-repeat-containing domain protein [Mucor mucedo]KAI7888207.1 WD40-repeat-containing domain protein [Mucor mucedo]